jgi:uncharacterized protein (DUF1697 family)
MRHVAFLRNLNQGQKGSPSSAALVDAFERAGAVDVALIQGNGTVLFDASSPRECADAAARVLAESSPWHDVVRLRGLEWIVRVVAEMEGLPVPDPRCVELSLFEEGANPPTALPIDGRRCRVVAGGAGYAITVNERANESNATPTLERALGVAVTSRGLPTLRRLTLTSSA